MSHASTKLRARNARQADAALLGVPVADHIRARLLANVDPTAAWHARYTKPPAEAAPDRLAALPVRRCDADPLMSEVVARTASVAVPVIQFCGVGGSRSGIVARAFAVASAARLGRTLLLEARPDGDGPADQPEAAQYWRSRARSCSGDIIPDCDANGLYHARVAYPVDRDEMSRENPLRGLAERAGLRFRMLVLDCAAPASCPDTIAVAGKCNGSVLVVQAGRSRLAEIQAAMRLLEGGGATLLGTVLEQSRTGPSSERPKIG